MTARSLLLLGLLGWALGSASCTTARPPQDPERADDAELLARAGIGPAPEADEQDPEDAEQAESEVLEERRRGAEVDEEIPDQAEPYVWWDFGPRLDALRGDLSLVAGGRIHVDYAVPQEQDSVVDRFGEFDPGLEVRRGFLELGGVYRQLEFNLWVNFARDFELFQDEGLISTDPDFRNVFVGLYDLPVVGGVRAGYFKEPFGLEEITSSNDITFMERSLTDAFVERRNLGVAVTDLLRDTTAMTLAFGGFQEANNDLETADGFGLTARWTWTPAASEDGRRLLHLGTSGRVGRPSDDTLRFVSRPESIQAPIMADTGTFAADRDYRAGVELAGVLGSWSLQSETMATRAELLGPGEDPTFWSTYLMASWVFTGEQRSYRTRVGAFGTVHPEHPVTAGGLGAWEMSGRYSYLDLDSGPIQGGTLETWTAGLNWYPDDAARVMFNYVAAQPDGVDTEHIVKVRLQISF